MLTEWLKQRASQFEKRDLSRTYVLVEGEDPFVLGYYALSTGSVEYQNLPEGESRGLPRLSVPVILLGRLAVTRTAQGLGLGSFLLIDALQRSLHIAEQIGIRAVEVHAVDETARQFYMKYGFIPLLDSPDHLYLSIRVIRKLNLPPPASSPRG